MGNPSGFGNPVSPSGRAALVEPPPHHISADAIQVIFHVDPAKATAYLPPGLELTEDALGYAYVADMLKVSDAHLGQEYDEPQRTQYREGIVGLYCQHDGVPGRFSTFIWVTADWSVVFGHYVGLAKKLADIWKTQVHAVNPAMGPIGVGTRLRGQVDRLGTRILDVGIDITEKIADDAVPSYGHRVYAYRDLPSPSPDVPSTRQLFGMDLAGATTVNAWKGTGTVRFQDGTNEELEALSPVEIVGAYHFQRGWTTKMTSRLLRDDSALPPPR